MSSLFEHPHEILRHIISFVPFWNVLDIRLVCKKLQEVCDTDPTFIEKRKIVIENHYNCVNSLRIAALGGHRDIVEFCIKRGASDLDKGMQYAALGGHRDLVEFFIEKGATDWDWGMEYAARGGHRKLVDLFIEKGATTWDSGMRNATFGGHGDLVKFFKQKKAETQ